MSLKNILLCAEFIVITIATEFELHAE